MAVAVDKLIEFLGERADRDITFVHKRDSLTGRYTTSPETIMDGDLIRGLSLVGAETLIPLKARAYVDLANRKAAGEQVDSRNVTKHRNDIFRLFTVLDRGTPIYLPTKIRSDLRDAFARLAREPTDLKPFGISGIQLPELLAELSRFYGLGDGISES